MKNLYFYCGIDWGMFLVGYKYEFQSFLVVVGPVYLEWYW